MPLLVPPLRIDHRRLVDTWGGLTVGTALLGRKWAYASDGSPVTFTAAMPGKVGPTGLAYAHAASGGFARARALHTFNVTEGAITLVALLRTSTTTTSAEYATLGSESGSAGNTLLLLRSGGASATDINWLVQDSAGAIFANITTSGITVNDGDWHCVVASATISTSASADIYIDGNFGATGTLSPSAPTSTSFQWVCAGGRRRGASDTAGTGAVDIGFVIPIYGRLSTRADLRGISSNPWQLFRPLNQQSYRRIDAVVTSGNTIAVPAGSLVLTGNAPTVVATANQTIAVPAGALVLTGNAPTVAVSDHQTVAVPAGALTLTGYEPTVTTTADHVIQVPKGALSLTGYAPTVGLTDHKTVAVPAGSLTLTGYAPAVDNVGSQTIAVPAGSLVLTAYAPSVTVAAVVATTTVGGVGRSKRKRRPTIIQYGDERYLAETEQDAEEIIAELLAKEEAALAKPEPVVEKPKAIKIRHAPAPIRQQAVQAQAKIDGLRERAAEMLRINLEMQRIARDREIEEDDAQIVELLRKLTENDSGRYH